MDPNQPPTQPITPLKPVPRIKKTAVLLLLIVLFILVISLGGIFLFWIIKTNKAIATIPGGKTSPTSLSNPSPSPDPLANWKTYVNTLHQYSLKYPPTWKTRAIGAGIGGKEAKSDSNGLDISEVGVKRTYPYGVFTIQGFTRSTESNYGLWKKSEISLGTTKANKYEYLNRKDLKSVAIVVKTPESKYLEILFRETPDSLNWAVFDQIISTFYFLDYLDPTGWNEYKNVKYGYQISYPTDLKIFAKIDGLIALSGKEINAEISIGKEKVIDPRALDTYYYTDNPISRTSTLLGQKVNIYEIGNSVVYVVWHDKHFYHLTFRGNTQMSEAELLILSTFQFIK